MHWYEQQSDFLKRRFGDDWKLVAGLLAATSPRVKLGVSWDMSMEIYNAVKVGREPMLNRYMKAHRLNIERVLKGKELSGYKVGRFYQNLIGNLEPVTIDTWMLKLWGMKLRSHNNYSKQYLKMERAFQKWARSKGEKPANMQAILWNYIRKKEGKSPVSFALIEVGAVPF